MSTVIKVENISKQYRLGDVGTGALAHDVNKWWHTIRGKENPYLKIGETNDRVTKGESDYVWALKDINFEVKQGEVLGIIGRNGAGKSTLLKILSKTTTPTTGSIKIKGRIASLLEVGTGFHPELSGRENIFLNGAILGMTKREIKSKFDEIVDFAGVERYIDTPVKRYSSGMYVRLAFGVAAHLEPEILIVDEVLAVGDAEFQKKALGKMKDVSEKDGRTVLFVSHNLQAIRSLTSTSLYMDEGKISFIGRTENAIDYYTSANLNQNSFNKNSKGRHVSIISVKLMDQARNVTSAINATDNIYLEIDLYTDGRKDLGIDIFLKDEISYKKIALCSFIHLEDNFLPEKKGSYKIFISLQSLNLAEGFYTIDVGISILKIDWDVYIEDVVKFEVLFCNPKNVSSWSLKQSFEYGNVAWQLLEKPKFIKTDNPV